MSTEAPHELQRRDAIEQRLSVRELAALLIKHYDIHEGLFDLLVEFQIGVGPVGPSPEQMLPGAAIAVSKVGLVPAKQSAPTTVDAAEVNPVKRSRRKATAARPE